jgi:hypothetical protein
MRFLILCMWSSTAAAVPLELTHQGRLMSPVGSPLHGAHTVRFTLYSDAAGTNDVWFETSSLTLADGYYAYTFGADSGNPLDVDDFSGALWLGVSVDGGPEIGAPTPLTSVPFAVRARTAESLDGDGVLLPQRTTEQRDAIAAPDEGLMLWNLTTHTLDVYDGSAWVQVGTGSGGSGTTPGDDDVVLLLHMDGSAGSSVFTDAKGHSIPVRGAPTQTTPAQFGNAAQLSSGNSIGPIVGSDLAFGTGDFTIEAWVNRSSSSGTGVVIGTHNYYVGGYNGVWTVYVQSNQAVFASYNDRSSPEVGVFPSTWATGTWYHLAVVRSGNTIELFQNGLSLGSMPHSKALDFGANGLYIGYDGNNGDWQGAIDEVRITRAALYSDNFTPPAAPFANPTPDAHCPGATTITAYVCEWTSPGTFTFTAPVTGSVSVTAIGGGGGGGGATSNNAYASGGGGGGYAKGVYNVTSGQPYTVTVGGGGARGTHAQTTGGSGGTSSVGSMLTATGGGGGLPNPASSSSGGAAGSGSGGTLANRSGGAGGTRVSGAPGGGGGAGSLSSNGQPGANGAGGAAGSGDSLSGRGGAYEFDGTAYGGGGGGSAGNSYSGVQPGPPNSNGNGAWGAPGLVRISW